SESRLARSRRWAEVVASYWNTITGRASRGHPPSPAERRSASSTVPVRDAYPFTAIAGRNAGTHGTRTFVSQGAAADLPLVGAAPPPRADEEPVVAPDGRAAPPAGVFTPPPPPTGPPTTVPPPPTGPVCSPPP